MLQDLNRIICMANLRGEYLDSSGLRIKSLGNITLHVDRNPTCTDLTGYSTKYNTSNNEDGHGWSLQLPRGLLDHDFLC